MLRDRSQLHFPITLVVTAALALLPAGWRLSWSRDLAEIVRFPMRPFTHAGTTLAGWLRPPPATIEGVSPEGRAIIEQLTRDRDEAQRLYHAEHLKVVKLREQIAQLQRIPVENRSVASRLVIAYVTMRSPGAALGPVELTLEAGAPRTVPAGTIAVHGGVHLLGRTVGPAEAGRCSLLPIANDATGPLRTAVFPRHDIEADLEEAARLHLLPTGGGTFTGEVPRDEPIAEGDVVRLADDAWPATAQMMVLGTVTDVRVDDNEPLRHLVTVEPDFVVRDVAEVTLVIEEDRDVAPSGPRGGAP